MQKFRLWGSPPDCYYFAGFTGSSGYVLQDCTQDKFYLLTDGRYAQQAAEQCTDKANVIIYKKLEDALCSIVPEGAEIHFDASFFRYRFVQQCRNSALHRYWVPLGQEAEQKRAQKNDSEIEHIKKACEIAELALRKTLQHWPNLKTEKDLSRFLENQIFQLGSNSLPFEFIVAQGKRSALPHGVASNANLGGMPLTIDWGAECSGYYSDQTVTIVPDRTLWSERWQEIYSAVFDAQQAAIQGIREGVRACDIDGLAREVLDQRGLGKYFVHSTGHGVGLEIHEYPGIAPSSATVLQRGMVITVEPGVYIEGFGGVRLEDTLLVTQDGYQYLTSINKAEPLFLDSVKL